MFTFLEFFILLVSRVFDRSAFPYLSFIRRCAVEITFFPHSGFSLPGQIFLQSLPFLVLVFHHLCKSSCGHFLSSFWSFITWAILLTRARLHGPSIIKCVAHCVRRRRNYWPCLHVREKKSARVAVMRLVDHSRSVYCCVCVSLLRWNVVLMLARWRGSRLHSVCFWHWAIVCVSAAVGGANVATGFSLCAVSSSLH